MNDGRTKWEWSDRDVARHGTTRREGREVKRIPRIIPAHASLIQGLFCSCLTSLLSLSFSTRCSLRSPLVTNGVSEERGTSDDTNDGSNVGWAGWWVVSLTRAHTTHLTSRPSYLTPSHSRHPPVRRPKGEVTRGERG